MPRCYLLTVCVGSSVDQQSNNATLFQLVEQVNLAATAPDPLPSLVPLELHAYFDVSAEEEALHVEFRFVLVGEDGAETASDAVSHQLAGPRLRTRTLGLPFPATPGAHELRVDWRLRGGITWHRENSRWPLLLLRDDPTPRITH